MTWITIHRHKGQDIQTRAEATPDQFGYRVEHPGLADRLYGTVQAAADAIEGMEREVQ